LVGTPQKGMEIIKIVRAGVEGIRSEASNTISAWKPASIRSEQKQDITMSLPTIIFCHGAYHPEEISARSLGFLNP